MSEFKREERYIVVKLKRILQDCKDRSTAAIWERKLRAAVPQEWLVDCVVVESDWPEYEVVWRLIEARVTGASRHYTQGVCGDGAAILEDGKPLTPDQIVASLNAAATYAPAAGMALALARAESRLRAAFVAFGGGTYEEFLRSSDGAVEKVLAALENWQLPCGLWVSGVAQEPGDGTKEKPFSVAQLRADPAPEEPDTQEASRDL